MQFWDQREDSCCILGQPGPPLLPSLKSEFTYNELIFPKVRERVDPALLPKY